MHTLVFSGFSLNELQIVFQGGEVMLSSAATGDGFTMSRDQWARTRIALNSSDTLVERTRLDAHYLDLNGDVLLSTIASDVYTEADREALFTIDEGNFGQPILSFGAGASDVEITAIDGQGGATIRFPGAPINPLVEVSPLLLDTQWAFIESTDSVTIRLAGFTNGPAGTAGDDTIIGTDMDDILLGSGGNDVVQGEGGDDHLDGGSGADTLLGGSGNDVVHGGTGHDNDILQGGPGDDLLDGAYSHDLYRFALGDGRDVIADTQGYHAFEFDSSIDPDAIALYYTGDGPDNFKLKYSATDWVESMGATSVQKVVDIRADGFPVALVQRSELVNGTFYDTRMNDVFETADGNDVIHTSGLGNDVFRVANGDGNDSVLLDEGYYPHVFGEIRLVDQSDVSFSFTGIDTKIAYAGGQLSLEAEKHFSDAARDNALNRFVITAETDPLWVPEIIAEGPGWLHGSFGSDRIIGSADFDVITPGYGNDLILSGGGADSIYLNDVYFNVNQAGVGHKVIAPGPGNDYIESPLYQGMTIYYDLGGGDDRVVYDWSYGERHPYRFSLSQNATQPEFVPHGEDVLAFGPGIGLDDLVFVRHDSSLQVALTNEPGSLQFENFFNVYEPQSVSSRSGLLDPFSGEDGGDYRLSSDDIATLFPRTPVRYIELADGSRHDMEVVLAGRMLVDYLIVQGTAAEDAIEASVANELILGHAGDDLIFDAGGENTIYAGRGGDHVTVNGASIVYAGEGDDYALLSGDGNTLFAGPGNDAVETEGDNALYMGEGNDEVLVLSGANKLDMGSGEGMVDMLGGSLALEFGASNGTDTVTYVSGQATLNVYLDEQITQNDLEFSVTEGLQGEGVSMAIEGSGAVLEMVALTYNPIRDEYESELEEISAEIHFSNGDRLSGHQLLALALGDPGEQIVGTDGNDKLVGTEAGDRIIGGAGNDRLEGLGGDDLFVFSGHGNGADRVLGGEGVDTLLGSDGSDSIGLKRLIRSDSIERIDGGAGDDAIVGTAGKNRLDFSTTELIGIARIEAGAGNDYVKGSAGDDVLVGGAGNDKLFGLSGSDQFQFSAGDGVDRIINRDPDPDSVDVLAMTAIESDDLWFSRDGKHLVIDVIGSSDQVTVNNWYGAEKHRLDMITADEHVLHANQVDSLVSAMAAFAVPSGEDAVFPQDARDALEPVLTAAWEVVA